MEKGEKRMRRTKERMKAGRYEGRKGEQDGKIWKRKKGERTKEKLKAGKN